MRSPRVTALVFSVICTVLFTLALIWDPPTIRADDGNSTFHFRVRWAQDSRAPAYRTEWFIGSPVTEAVQFHTSYLTLPVKISDKTVGMGGWSSYVSTDYTSSTYPRGLAVKRPQDSAPFVSTIWNSDGCLSGPEVLLESNSDPTNPWLRVSMRNTTDRMLTLDDTGNPLLPIDNWQTKTFDRGFQLRWRDQAGTECVSVSWTLPAKVITPGPVISKTLNLGWNLVSMPQTREGYSANQVLAELAQQGLEPEHLAQWYFGAWQSHIYGFLFNNFALAAGQGYFLRVNRSGVWQVR